MCGALFGCLVGGRFGCLDVFGMWEGDAFRGRLVWDRAVLVVIDADRGLSTDLWIDPCPEKPFQ